MRSLEGWPPARQMRRLSVCVITLSCVTTTVGETASRAGGGAGSAPSAVLLDAGTTSRCRRRVHLDHDPAAAAAPRALPDPALEQRRADAAEHRSRIGALLATGAGPGWHAGPDAASSAERIAATAAAVAAGAAMIWEAVLPSVVPDAGGPIPAAGRRGGAELLVRLPAGGYVPVIVVRHRVSDPGAGAVTTALPEARPERALPDESRKVRSQPRDLLRLAHLHRMLGAAGWAPEPDAPHAAWGGVIGMDADVVVWHDLAAGPVSYTHLTLPTICSV